jgi:hypothetical protein
MALRILTASDPLIVDRLTVAIYGEPGTGKTSLAFTSDSPLLLDFDRGAYRAVGRKDTVQVKGWEEVAAITPDDLRPYATVIVDTAGRALDMLTADIIRRDGKLGRAGTLTLQGYGRLKTEFAGWLKMLHEAGKDVVLVAHGSEQKSGDDTVIRLDVQGGSKDEIYKSADLMGRLYISDKSRILDFDPHERGYGKNPGGIPQSSVDPADTGLLARLIAETKAAINAKSEASQVEYERVEALRAEIASLATPDEFTAMSEKLVAASASQKDKALLMAEASRLGFVWSKTRKGFALPEAEKPEAEKPGEEKAA